MKKEKTNTTRKTPQTFTVPTHRHPAAPSYTTEDPNLTPHIRPTPPSIVGNHPIPTPNDRARRGPRRDPIAPPPTRQLSALSLCSGGLDPTAFALRDLQAARTTHNSEDNPSGASVWVHVHGDSVMQIGDVGALEAPMDHARHHLRRGHHCRLTTGPRLRHRRPGVGIPKHRRPAAPLMRPHHHRHPPRGLAHSRVRRRRAPPRLEPHDGRAPRSELPHLLGFATGSVPAANPDADTAKPRAHLRGGYRRRMAQTLRQLLPTGGA